MNSFTNTLTVDQTPEQVFHAINNPRAWWSENITGLTDRQGKRFLYAYRNSHTCEILVEELSPFTKVVWHVVDNHFEFVQDDSEWVDTRIVFDIARQGEKTVLTFTHVGLVPDYECYEICEKAWTFFTGDSLYKLIAAGKGDPLEMREAMAEGDSRMVETGDGAKLSKQDLPTITAVAPPLPAARGVSEPGEPGVTDETETARVR